MNSKIFSTVILSTLATAMFFAAPAEARRLHWWEQGQTEFAPVDDNYDDATYADDQQDQDARDMFNQEQYDLYMRQMGHPKRKRAVASYYDPQVDQPVYKKLPPLKAKKKIVQKVAIAKPIAKKPILAPEAKSLQTASISNRFDQKSPTKKIDCGKGLSIVSGYGFSGVTTKTCSGDTLIYNATRSGKNFEIQVSATNGELTNVKRL